MSTMIECKKVSFSYGEENEHRKIIDQLDFSVERGSFTVILGQNGSGKSTLAKLFNGLLKPTDGTVTVDGINTRDETHELDIKRRVGMVFQNPDNQLVASIVEEDVAFGPENLGLDPSEIRRRVDEALRAVGMYEFRESTPHHLSGGQKQRIAIAGVLAMQPECIVLDEPTAMLDPKGRAEILKTVLRLNREHGITVILITHFMEEAEEADRVVVLHQGKILADGAPSAVFSQDEILHTAGLELPQTTELLVELKKNGWKVETNKIGIEDTADAVLSALHLEES
ncbi:MAG: energy-coupling factor transporter ATPase [Clostridia bacterium]|nr:energy-coupling factor transporter ATPase [Clostridia bacterium]